MRAPARRAHLQPWGGSQRSRWLLYRSGVARERRVSPGPKCNVVNHSKAKMRFITEKPDSSTWLDHFRGGDIFMWLQRRAEPTPKESCNQPEFHSAHPSWARETI